MLFKNQHRLLYFPVQLPAPRYAAWEHRHVTGGTRLLPLFLIHHPDVLKVVVVSQVDKLHLIFCLQKWHVQPESLVIKLILEVFFETLLKKYLTKWWYIFILQITKQNMDGILRKLSTVWYSLRYYNSKKYTMEWIDTYNFISWPIMLVSVVQLIDNLTDNINFRIEGI